MGSKNTSRQFWIERDICAKLEKRKESESPKGELTPYVENILFDFAEGRLVKASELQAQIKRELNAALEMQAFVKQTREVLESLKVYLEGQQKREIPKLTGAGVRIRRSSASKK